MRLQAIFESGNEPHVSGVAHTSTSVTTILIKIAVSKIAKATYMNPLSPSYFRPDVCLLFPAATAELW